MRRRIGITIHHSAVGGSVLLSTIEQHHIRLGYGQVGYHFYIPEDGSLWVGCSLNSIGAHCNHAGRNSTHFGICLGGNFENKAPTRLQMETLIEILCRLCAKFGIDPDAIEGHGDVPGTNTQCPGKFLKARLPWIKQRVKAFLPLSK